MPTAGVKRIPTSQLYTKHAGRNSSQLITVLCFIAPPYRDNQDTDDYQREIYHIRRASAGGGRRREHGREPRQLCGTAAAAAAAVCRLPGGEQYSYFSEPPVTSKPRLIALNRRYRSSRRDPPDAKISAEHRFQHTGLFEAVAAACINIPFSGNNSVSILSHDVTTQNQAHILCLQTLS